VRFFWGLGLLLCLVFADGWAPRAALTALGLLLALLSGKRVSFGYNAFLVGSVLVFNLFLPVGRVWFALGPVTITEGAFFLGLGKGLTFAGLVFFSLASVSRRLRLPGRFGALWGRTFSWYEQLMDQRGALKPRALLLSVDRLLERLYPTRTAPVPSTAEPSETAPPPTTVAGWFGAGLTLAAAAAASVLWR
jgi:heptaprenyl diphosphate synthase